MSRVFQELTDAFLLLDLQRHVDSIPNEMRILVIGSGGREHALLWSLKKNAAKPLDLFCAPGNAGIAQIAECLPVSATDIATMRELAIDREIDLVIVGPEAPLAAGIVDDFEREGLRIVGPRKAAARLEASKAFAKEFMRRHGIPTAPFRVATSREEAIEILRSGEFGDKDTPVVVKADGLAAGKGVVVAKSRALAERAVDDLFGGAVSPEACDRLIIEAALNGLEASLLLFSDGKDFRLMPAARDHKRVGDNDTGPNTGGMGSITNADVLDTATLERVVKEIVEPTLNGARSDGFPFRGTLFIGLMLTAEGPQVLEYNVRFGDPEAQAILVRLQTDLVEIFEAIANQRLAETEVRWSNQSSVCVVLAAKGYPSKPVTGDRIFGLDKIEPDERIALFHAATSRGANGEWLTAGGRVLGVTATGTNLNAALERAYGAVQKIRWDGMHCRRDIGRSLAAEGTAGR